MRLDVRWILASVVVLGLGVYVYVQQGGFRAPSGDEVIHASNAGDRRVYCHALRGEPRERLGACLTELRRKPRQSRPASDLIEEITESGPVLYIGGKVEGDGFAVIEDHPELLEPLLGRDEPKAARALREQGFRGLSVHRDLTGALDRDAVVLSRLANHDDLEWFQLRYVTDSTFLYTVRRSPTRVPLGTGERLLAGLRQRLEGRPVQRQSWNPSHIRVLGSMRLGGRTLVLRHSAGNDIEVVLDDLADKLRRRWEREIEIYGHGRLDDRLDELRLEVQVVMERAPVEPRSRPALADLWEMGIDGMMFRDSDGAEDEKFSYLPGSELVTRSIKTADEFLQAGVEEGGWNSKRPWEDPTTRLDIIRTQHFMESRPGGGPAVRLVRGMPEVSMDEVTDESLREMHIDGGEWWVRNQRPDGSFLYKYWPTQNRRSTEYNEVRHILAARDLSVTASYRPDPRYLRAARRSMDWLLRYEVNAEDPETTSLPHPPPGTALFRYNNNQKLGTTAVGLLGWIAWAKVTGDHSEDERIRRMARFVQSMALDNGKFDPYYVPWGHPYHGQKNDIVPGEAALALGEVAEYFGEPEWLDFMPKFLDFYEPWWERRVKKTIPTGRWPHHTYDNAVRLDLVQFGPWAVMATRQYYLLTGDQRAAEFGLEIADWMIDTYQWSSDRAPFPDYVGGYYKIPTELPAMQSFCYSEGTAAAYHIAALYRPEAKDKYDRATRETLRFLRVMQFDDLDSYFTPRPEIVHGGIKYAMNENKVRIDYVGHGLSTIAQYLAAREADPAVELELAPLKVPEGGAPYRTSFEMPPVGVEEVASVVDGAEASVEREAEGGEPEDEGAEDEGGE